MSQTAENFSSTFLESFSLTLQIVWRISCSCTDISNSMLSNLSPQAKNVYFEFPDSVIDIILPKFSLAVLLLLSASAFRSSVSVEPVWGMPLFLSFHCHCDYLNTHFGISSYNSTATTFLFPVLSSNLSPFNSSSSCSKNSVPEIPLLCVIFLLQTFFQYGVVLYCSIGYRHIWFIHILIAIWPPLYCYF